MGALSDEADGATVTDLVPAEARAQIEQAITAGTKTVPPFESDTYFTVDTPEVLTSDRRAHLIEMRDDDGTVPGW